MTCPKVKSYFLDEAQNSYTFILEDDTVLSASVAWMAGCNGPADFQAKMEAIYEHSKAGPAAEPVSVPEADDGGTKDIGGDQEQSGGTGDIDTGLTTYSN